MQYIRIGVLSTVLVGALSSNIAAAVHDWRRQVIYLALVDRFANGDSGNDQSHGVRECNDPTNPHAYQGGDLAGLTNQMDYLSSLGATTLWISPLYRGVSAMQGKNCGFPGYWADFGWPYELQIDPRFGSASDFDRLIDSVHSRGMKLILDMVVNHAGYDARLTHQRPWWFNEPSHCQSYGPAEIFCPLAGLPDFDHRQPDVRDYLVDAHRAWLQRFRIDGIRMDTVKHVDPNYFAQDWLPAMRQHRPDAFIMGELLDEHSFDAYHSYLAAGFDGLFNFPLRHALIDSFAKGKSVDVVAAKMQESLAQFGEERASYMVNLLDNHDVPRFVQEIPYGIPSEDSHKRYLLALSALLTIPGVPQIYYGNEIGMDGGADPFNRRFMPGWAFDSKQRSGAHPGYLSRPDAIFEHVRKLLLIRRSNPSLQIGRYQELWRQNGAGNANIWAFARHAAGEGAPVVVALNNGYRHADVVLPIEVGHLFSEGTVLRDILGQAAIAPLTVRDGVVELNLPGQTAVILVPRK
jgi:alpha-amylase